MARKTIEDFDDADALSDTDLAGVSQDGDGTMVKTNLGDLKEFFQKGLPYSFGFSISGLTTAPGGTGSVITIVFAEAVDFADDFAGCYLKAAAAATGSTVFTIKKNGSTVGTATVSASGTTATFVTSGGGTSFAVDDVMTIHCPDTPDATLADIGFGFFGVRTA